MAYRNLSNHTTLHSLMARFLWFSVNGGTTFMLLYSQLHTHLPHPLHSLSFHSFTQSQTIPEPSQESHGFMWHACRATVPLDSSKSKGNFVTSFGWLDTPTLQCNFLFIFEQKENSLNFLLPSTLTRNHAWIQTGCCCDFRRRQHHPWIQTGP